VKSANAVSALTLVAARRRQPPYGAIFRPLVAAGDARDEGGGCNVSVMATRILTPGEDLGGYVVIRALGAGGSGQVYLVRGADGTEAALKRVDAHDDPVAAERLRREVSALMAVRHPAVPRVLDAELDDEDTFVVFEYIAGQALAEHVASQGPLQGEELAHMAQRIAGALEAAHAAGVVHRDVTPANVMMSPEGAVLIDFGLSHRTDDERLTREGLVSGTAGYVAPEVIDGDEPGAGADRWSWAATVAYAMTGKAPFGVGSSAIRKTLAGGWKHPDLPGAEALAAALDRAPDARPGMRDVVAALRGATLQLPMEPTAVMDAGVDVDVTDQFDLVDEAGVDDAAAYYDDNGVWIGDEGGDFVLRASSELIDTGAPVRRRALVATWAIASAVAASLAPVVAAAAVLISTWVARIVFRRAESLRLMRARRGGRWHDSVLYTVSLPWHVARAFGELAPSLLTAVVVGGGTAALGWHLVSIGALASTTDYGQSWGHAIALGLGLLCFQAALWWGLWSWGTREGAYRALESIAPTRGVAAAWIVVAVIVAVSIGAAVYVGADVWWWPLPSDVFAT